MTSTRTLQQILEFYRMRGYVARLGSGERCAVIVIDFSCAFTRGAAGFPGGDFADALAATRLLLDRARGRVPVIFTTIAYEPDMRDAGLWAVKVPWLRACQLDDVAAEIDPVLARQPSEPVIVKKYPSAFFGTDLHARLQQACIDTVLIAGCTTSVCIRATALDAMQHGYRLRAVQRSIPLTEEVESETQQKGQIVGLSRLADSDAARSPNLCTATNPSGGCLAIVRPVDRLAQRDPGPTPGRRKALSAALRSAVLDPRRGDRRQLVSLDRNVHHGAPPPTERRLWSALEARASPYRHSLHLAGP
jgi:maleamate amidohydrolase